MAQPSTPIAGLRILGIDPGSLVTGFGLVERSGSRLVALDHGVLRASRETALSTRLALLSGGLDALLAQHAPSVAVLEKAFYGVNPRSLMVLAQARGAILAALGRAGIEVAEYSPAEVKTAVTGNGRAEKTQVARMVSLLLKLPETPLVHDATDALALALCYAQRAPLDRLARLARSG